MHRSLICLVVLISAIVCSGKLVEWPVTLHHDIQSSADDGIDQKHGSRSPVDPPSHTAGYLSLDHTHDARLFYYYAQERNKNPDAPLVWWFNGGPHSDSMIAAFGGKGPFVVQEDLKLKWNPFGWDQGHNMLFVDQPVGTGFSVLTDEQDTVYWEEQVGADGLMFLLEFMELHPELQGKELFLAGISFAGHYIPAIAHAIHKFNKAGESMHLNLKGVLLENPSIYELYFYIFAPKYALMNNLISKEAELEAALHIEECIEFFMECNREMDMSACAQGVVYCTKYLYDPVLKANPNIDVYDIRRTKENFDGPDGGAGSITKYLNLPKVQLQLGVNTTWKLGGKKAFMTGELMTDKAPRLVNLLNEGIRVMVYSADQDYRRNWMGNKELLNDMEWQKSDQWQDKLKPWIIVSRRRDIVIGGCEVVEPMTHCRIYDQGRPLHPQLEQEIGRRFIAGEAFVAPDPTVALKRAHEGRKEVFAAT